jgi:hypothetical protein
MSKDDYWFKGRFACFANVIGLILQLRKLEVCLTKRCKIIKHTEGSAIDFIIRRIVCFPQHETGYAC